MLQLAEDTICHFPRQVLIKNSILKKSKSLSLVCLKDVEKEAEMKTNELTRFTFNLILFLVEKLVCLVYRTSNKCFEISMESPLKYF